jgi:DNA-binding GntR family transcriptional regulator
LDSLTGIKRPASLTEAVYWRLYDQLMTHGIAAGARLSVDSLARELDVSQTPIREALVRLEAQALVVKVHLVGYRVAERIARDRLDQIYEMRLLTEPRLAALAAERMTDPDRRALTEMAAEMAAEEGAAQAPEAYARFSRLDEAFHRLIATASGNQVIANALADLHVHVHLFRLSQPPTAISDAILEHDRLVAAIVGGDAAAAEAAMLQHVLRSRRRYGEERLQA